MGRFALVLTASAALFSAALAEEKEAPKSEGTGARVPEVKDAYGHIVGEKLVATVVGEVPTGGWTDPKLSPIEHVMPPEDGIWGFNFEAKKPTGIVTQVLSPIVLKDESVPIVDKMKGIRVFGENDQNVVLRLVQTKEGEFPEFVDDVRITSATVEKHGGLKLEATYGGGVARHDFELVWNGVYLESAPPVAVMRLIHDGNDDEGEAIKTETLRFALPPLDPTTIRIQYAEGQQLDVKFPGRRP